jgi:hypothetical protein
VNSKTTSGFWAQFERLPVELQSLARKKYRVWQHEPFHPSLHFKEIVSDLWSVRVNAKYRALARRKGDLVVWFWIGTHEEYERLISNA